MSKRFLFLLCCLGLSGLMITGCGDDNSENGEPDATIDMTDDDGDTTPDVGCTDEQCLADGLVCNETTGMCEDPGDGTCTMANGLCDPNMAQPTEFICVEDGEGGGICATPCSDTQPCAAGSFCAQGGFCVESECSHFFDNDCPAGEKCIPQPNQSWICTTQGAGMEGATCEGFGECADGLLCIGGTCETPECTPMTNIQACAGANEECSGGLTFGDGDDIDLGFCNTPCTAFVSNSGCEDGQWCAPADTLPANATEFTGNCVDGGGGTASPGDVCDGMTPATTCGDPESDPAQPAQICINFGDEATCEQMCDPAAAEGEPGSCPTGEGCFEQNLSLNGMPFTPAWGLCEVTCDPWAGLGNGGCGMDEFCFPDFNDASIGTCTARTDDPMPAQRGDDCDFDDETPDIHECEDGLFCLGGTCEVPCDVGATGMEGGQCEEAAEFCSQLSLQDGSELDLGVCQIGCTYAHGDRFNPTVACPEMDQVCQMAELFGDVPSDICTSGYSEDLMDPPLDEFEDCPAGTEGSFCRPGGICFDLDGITDGVQCVEVCAFSEGQQGSTNHPDCTRSEAACQGGFLNPELGLGVCGNAG